MSHRFYAGSLYWQGKPEQVSGFKEQLKEELDSGRLEIQVADRFDTAASISSSGRIGRLSFQVEAASGPVSDVFEYILHDFDNDPFLDFFFEIEEYTTSLEEGCGCGYSIYWISEGSGEYFFKSGDYDGETALEAKHQAYNENIAPRLLYWLSGDEDGALNHPDPAYYDELPPDEAESLFCEVISMMGWFLQFVPDPYKTLKVCIAACTTISTALEYVPEALQAEVKQAVEAAAARFPAVPWETVKNTGRLCSVYCPNCGKVTDKISFNLLREAEQVTVQCTACGGETYLAYNGKTVRVSHNDLEAEEGIARHTAFQRWWRGLSEAERNHWLLTNGS